MLLTWKQDYFVFGVELGHIDFINQIPCFLEKLIEVNLYVCTCMYVYLFGSNTQDTMHEIIHIRI